MNQHGDKQLTQEHGEGTYKATEDYNKRTKDFIGSGKVDEAARDAEPKSADEKVDMIAAEQKAKARSKGEDPTKGMANKSDV
jgi:hypothetical protein